MLYRKDGNRTKKNLGIAHTRARAPVCVRVCWCECARALAMIHELWALV
jgi:hypothetical protein